MEMSLFIACDICHGFVFVNIVNNRDAFVLKIIHVDVVLGSSDKGQSMIFTAGITMGNMQGCHRMAGVGGHDRLNYEGGALWKYAGTMVI